MTRALGLGITLKGTPLATQFLQLGSTFQLEKQYSTLEPVGVTTY